jgi:soluble lytic murein transglycosylase-like protein
VFRIAPTALGPLPLLGLVLGVIAGCRSSGPQTPLAHRPVAVTARVPLLETYVQSWRVPPPVQVLRGMRLLADAPLPATPAAAVIRAIVRSNHRMAPFDALILAVHALGVAAAHHLDYGFFSATLLQESGFAPDALSAAGAVGIAQFTLDTADAYGVDPFDWRDAMGASAALLGAYVSEYDGVYPDPYAVALAAYNAGPGAVAQYRGVPPYAETRGYVDDVYLRWARLVVESAGQVGSAGRIPAQPSGVPKGTRASLRGPPAG